MLFSFIHYRKIMPYNKIEERQYLRIEIRILYFAEQNNIKNNV